MVELSEHLLDLVFRQKSAIIPELGTFKFVSTSAKLNFGENVILPPSQSLVFTESTFDQGELTFQDFLVKEKNFDPYEAGIRIKAYVHQIRNNLKQLGYSYIPGFGTLHLLENDGLRFVAGDKIKAAKPTMGLPELAAIPIAREFAKNQELESEVEITSFIDNRSENVTSEKNRWAMPAIFGFLLLGIGLIAYYLYQSNYGSNSNTETVTPVAVNEDSIALTTAGFVDTSYYNPDDSLADKEAIMAEIEKVPEVEEVKISPEKKIKPVEKVKVPPAETKTEVATPDPVIPDSGKICAIIVGAMGNPANAVKLAKTVKNKGYTPYTYKTKGLTKVGAKCDCDESSIQSTLQAMKKINSSAWVYESD